MSLSTITGGDDDEQVSIVVLFCSYRCANACLSWPFSPLQRLPIAPCPAARFSGPLTPRRFPAASLARPAVLQELFLPTSGASSRARMAGPPWMIPISMRGTIPTMSRFSPMIRPPSMGKLGPRSLVLVPPG